MMNPGTNNGGNEATLAKNGPCVTGPVKMSQNGSVTKSQAVLIIKSVASNVRSKLHDANATARVISMGTTNGVVVDGVYGPTEMVGSPIARSGATSANVALAIAISNARRGRDVLPRRDVRRATDSLKNKAPDKLTGGSCSSQATFVLQKVTAA